MTVCKVCKNVNKTFNKKKFFTFKEFIKNLSENVLKFLEDLTKLCLDALIDGICTNCINVLEDLDKAHKKCKEIEEVLTSLHVTNNIKSNDYKCKDPNEVTVATISPSNDVKNIVIDKTVIIEETPQVIEERVQQFSNEKNQNDSKCELPLKKVFPCLHCDKVFNLKGTLKRHTHLHTGELPYQCDLCGKRFTHLSSFKIHKLTHLGEKNYKCSICEKMLISSSHLKRHMIGHTGEKNYQCDKCGKKFTQRYNLVAHEKIHN